MDTVVGLDHWWPLQGSTTDLASGVAATGSEPTFSLWTDPNYASMICNPSDSSDLEATMETNRDDVAAALLEELEML